MSITVEEQKKQDGALVVNPVPRGMEGNSAWRERFPAHEFLKVTNSERARCWYVRLVVYLAWCWSSDEERYRIVWIGCRATAKVLPYMVYSEPLLYVSFEDFIVYHGLKLVEMNEREGYLVPAKRRTA